MTYGPYDRLPELHLDPPETRECQHPGIDDAECPACRQPSNFWCADCEWWRQGRCLCDDCDICLEPQENCPGHPDIEPLIEETTP